MVKDWHPRQRGRCGKRARGATLASMVTDDFLSLDQAARLLRRSKQDLREMVRSGQVPAIRKDARWMVHRRDLPAIPPAGGVAVRHGTRTNITGPATASSHAASPPDATLACI